MRASKPSNDHPTGRWSKLVMAINCSARDSHYSERHYFCNIFFRFVSNEIQLQNIVYWSCFQDYFLQTQTSLEWEDRWSHASHSAIDLCVWNVANAIDRYTNSLEKSGWLNTVRRMFGATTSYFFFMVLPLVGRSLNRWTRRVDSLVRDRSLNA